MPAIKNYAGNRLSPWLGHLMVTLVPLTNQLKLLAGVTGPEPPTSGVAGRKFDRKNPRPVQLISASNMLVAPQKLKRAGGH
jgi:hypothetical protein